MEEKEYRSQTVGSEQIKNPYHGTIHIVQAGDNLYAISRKYHVEVKDIILENPYVNLYNMGIGEEILIPVSTVEIQK